MDKCRDTICVECVCEPTTTFGFLSTINPKLITFDRLIAIYPEIEVRACNEMFIVFNYFVGNFNVVTFTFAPIKHLHGIEDEILGVL